MGGNQLLKAGSHRATGFPSFYLEWKELFREREGAEGGKPTHKFT